MAPKRVAKTRTGKPGPPPKEGKRQSPKLKTDGFKSGFFKYQTWILWFGLMGGLFYGWVYDKYWKPGPTQQPVETYVLEQGFETPWTVADIPGKGKGAIASRDIRQGELILREKPLFLVPPSITSSPAEYIWDKVQSLDKEQKQAFFNLSFIGLPQNVDREKNRKRVALAIFETNAASAGGSVGIFPRMARLNHGCSSGFNVVYSYREQEEVLVVYALKPIARGSEVLTTYSDTKKPREQRRAYLQEHYGFHCTCSSCALPDDESKASDDRLLSITRHYAELATWIQKKITGVEAIQHVKAIWKLGDEEGYLSERGRLAGDAVWVAAGHGDAAAVREWSSLAMRWYGYELGADSPQVAEMEAVVLHPQAHQAWNTRERLNVGGPEGIR